MSDSVCKTVVYDNPVKVVPHMTEKFVNGETLTRHVGTSKPAR